MPTIGAAVAIAEAHFINTYALDIPRERFEQPLDALFSIFAQHTSTTKQAKIRNDVINHLVIISNDAPELPYGTGLQRRPVAYKRICGTILLAESSLDIPGHLEWGALLRAGDAHPFTRPIKHYDIAADAVAEFYRPGLQREGLRPHDHNTLWIAKYLLPTEFHGASTRALAHRLANTAKSMDANNPGSGLQFIYEQTR